MHWTYCHIDGVTAQELQKAYDGLAMSRKAHIDRLRQEKDRIRSLVGELLVQRLLAEHYGIKDAKLNRKENGQPYLTGCSLYVSITHCEDLVACAVSENPVGIDLEKIRPVDLKLCRHVCQPEEKTYVLGEYPENTDGECLDEQVLERFFEIWTAKEAYFKKCGTGITNLKSVNVLPVQRQIHRSGDYMLQIL